jgi:hypothetical protein
VVSGDLPRDADILFGNKNTNEHLGELPASALAERVDRIERMLSELPSQVGQAPALVATVTDSVDGWIDKAAERGIAVDDRAAAVGRLLELLTRPNVVALVEKLVELGETAPKWLAAAVDTIDTWMGQAQQRGLDIEERLKLTRRRC